MIKKIVFSLFFILIILIGALPFFAGIQSEKIIRELLEKTDSSKTYQITISEYDRGWLSSDITVDLQGKEELEYGYHQLLDQQGYYPEPLKIQIKGKLSHGPFPIDRLTDPTAPKYPILGFLDAKIDASEGSGKFLQNVLGQEKAPVANLLLNLDGSGKVDILITKLNMPLTVQDQKIELALENMYSQINFDADFKAGSLQSNTEKVHTTSALFSGEFVSMSFSGGYQLASNGFVPAGRIDMSLASAQGTLNAQGNQFVLFMNQMALKGKLDNSRTLASSKFKINFDQLGFNNFRVNKAVIDAGLTGIDPTILQGITAQVQQIQSIGFNQQQLMQRIPAMISPYLTKMMRNSPQLTLNQLAFDLDNGHYQVDGKLGLSGKPASPTKNPLVLLKALNTKLNFSIPAVIIQDIIKQQVNQEVKDKAGIFGRFVSSAKPLINQAVDAKLKLLESQGILKREGPNYRINLLFVQGKLNVNGLDFQVPGL